MADNFKYTAFISYSHADKAAVEKLHRALERYNIPKTLVGRETPHGKVPKKFKPFFRDRDDLSAATNLTASIKKALKQSQFLIVVCSPNATTSPWVAKEILEFKKLRDQNRILCLIVDDAPKPKKTTFPEALWEGLSAKEKISYQPIAADARPSGDGQKLAKLKLISGMLGIELDSLIQRETKRRQIQVSILAGIFTTATVILSVLLYVATEARKEAEVNRLEAEERQFQAEQLIGFMLGDLKRNLEPIGNLQIMDSIAIQALGYYASIDPEKMTAEALSQRSEVLLMLGEVQLGRGNSDQAKSAFIEAFNTTGELLNRNPDNLNLIFDHSQTVFWLAVIDLRKGNFVEAERQFQLYADYAKILAQKEPENLDYRIEVGYAHSNLGTLYFNQGEFSAAEREFQSQLNIFQELAIDDPGTGVFDFDLVQSHAWLASSQMGLGKLQLAKEQRLKELALLERLLESDPRNINNQEALAVTHQSLGAINALMGEEKTGLLHFQKGIEIAEALIAFDPENTNPVEYLTLIILDRLEILETQTDPEQTKNLINRLKTLTQFLLERDPTASDWIVLKSRSSLVEAENLFKAGKVEEVLALAELTNSNLISLLETENQNYTVWAPLGFSALVLAEAYELVGQPEKADEALKVFINLAEPSEANLTVRTQDFLARAWLLAGFANKAKQKRDFLTEIGYSAPDFQLFWEEFGN